MIRTLIVACAMATATAASAASYVVAPLGTAGGSGTAQDPFGSIAACTAVATSGDTCLLSPGTYRETAIPASGVTIAAAARDTATIDGSDVLTGWQSEGNGVWSIAYGKPAALPTIQLFFGAQAGIQARWPKIGSDPIAINWARMHTGTNITRIVDAALPSGDLTGAIVHMFSGSDPFTQKSALVTASTPGVIRISDDAPQDCGFSCAQPGGRYFLFGLRAFLSQPGEWCYDGGRLYIIPPAGFDPNGGATTVKARLLAVDLTKASNVTVRDVNLFGASVAMGAATHDNTLFRIHARYVSEFDRLTETGNGGDTGSVGAFIFSTGIILTGKRQTIDSSVIEYSAGNGVLVNGDQARVTNNLIRDAGLFGTYASPVFVSGGKNMVVAHNTIIGTVGYGIAGLGGDAPGLAVSYNNVFRTMRWRVDGASVYFCCAVTNIAGAHIDHNWVHDTSPTGFFGPAIYVDNGLSAMNIYQNVAARPGADGFYLNGMPDPAVASGNIVRNNTALIAARSLVISNQSKLTVRDNQFQSDGIVTFGTATYATPPVDNGPSAPGASDLLPSPKAAGVGCNFGGCATPN